MNIQIKDSLILASKIIVCIIAIVIVYLIGIYSRRNIPLFEIKDVYIKSTANATHLDDNTNESWNLNINQSNDIYIKFGHIDNIHTVNGNDKLLKEVYIDNIKIINFPLLGSGIDVYTISKDETKIFEYIDEYLVQDKIKYVVLPNNANIYNNEVNNTSGQLAISFVNKDVLSYIYQNVSELVLDGTLLKNAGVSMEQIEFTVSFDITFVTQTDKEYVYNMTLVLPYGDILENGTSITSDMTNIQIVSVQNKMEE